MHACMHVRSADSKPHPAVLLSVCQSCYLAAAAEESCLDFLGRVLSTCGLLVFSAFPELFFFPSFKPRRNAFLFFFWKTRDERRGGE